MQNPEADFIPFPGQRVPARLTFTSLEGPTPRTVLADSSPEASETCEGLPPRALLHVVEVTEQGSVGGEVT